jgi:protoporphyrinogen oxidase
MAEPEQGSDQHVVIAGAGPAGLTAAVELVRRDRPVVVLEATDAVGGISQTVERDGWRFDIGGHRFFTKVKRVDDWWHEILADDEFLSRPRMSRISYQGKLFDYPLKPMNALRGLGVIEAIRCIASYLWVRVHPPKDQTTFEGWTAARFGWRLYRIFFKTYTEKLWGIPATEIQADWAAQRIKNLSLGNAVWNALFPKKGQTDIARSPWSRGSTERTSSTRAATSSRRSPWRSCSRSCSRRCRSAFSPRRAGCATATSSRSPWSCRRAPVSRTTGSTSTRRA